MTLAALAFLLGSTLAYRSKESWLPTVSPIIILLVAPITIALTWFLSKQVIEAASSQPAFDLDRLVGMTGHTSSDIRGLGTVYVNGEEWTAQSHLYPLRLYCAGASAAGIDPGCRTDKTLIFDPVASASQTWFPGRDHPTFLEIDFGGKAMDPTQITLLCLVGAVVLLVVVFLSNAIRIVSEYQRLVVFRLGRCVGEKGPGVVLLIPIIDRASPGRFARTGPRNSPADLDHQRCAPISIDFFWSEKVFGTQPPVFWQSAILSLQHREWQPLPCAPSSAVLLDDVLSERETINNILRTRLDERSRDAGA